MHRLYERLHCLFTTQQPNPLQIGLGGEGIQKNAYCNLPHMAHLPRLLSRALSSVYEAYKPLSEYLSHQNHMNRPN